VFLTAPDPPDHVKIPKTREAVWVERLLWLFALSFAFDYRNAVAREGQGGTGIDQLLFLLSCVGATLGIVILGWRSLTVRPGAWLIGFWAVFVGFMLVNATLQGVMPSRSLRVTLPLAFCLFGMINVHIAGCMGIRPGNLVRPILVGACINVVWRIFYGLNFTGATLETSRLEVMSPATNWVTAWIGCAMLLRGRFHWSLLVASGIVFTGILVTVTRSLFFPVIASGLASGFCLMLSMRWGMVGWSGVWKRMVPLGAAFGVLIFGIAAVAVVQPRMLERWNERLFHLASTQNLSADISYLTRKAEADAMMKILSEDPVHFINGKGIGSSYYWDRAYIPEINLVIPNEGDNFDGMWFAGHSVWTYSLLSGGVIALLAFILLLISTAWLSVISAKQNSSDPGPDQWLAFLPFIATCCLLSETLTANPFDARLVGIIFGMMAGLPQAFMVRASWIHTSVRQQAPVLS
jgi:hypothetical protein